MKMRCVIPAGFHHKWLHVISMHGLGKRRAPLFNYGFIFFIFLRRGGGDEDDPGTAERGGWSRVPRTALLLVISNSNDASRGNQEGKNLHTCARLNIQSSLYVAAGFHPGPCTTCQNCHTHCSAAFQFPCAHTETHADPLHIKQLSTC